MIVARLIFVIGSMSAVPEKPSLVEIAEDAQVANAERSNSGFTQFRSSLTIRKKRPMVLEGSFSWRGDDGLWAFKLSDPDSLMVRGDTNSKEIKDCKIEEMLIKKEILYVTDPHSNKLFIQKLPARRDQLSGTYFFLDLYPKTLWLRCCPPHHTPGMSWIELTAPNSSATSPGSKTRVESVGDDIHRFIREDPGAGRMTIDFSMKYAGNVVSAIYSSEADTVPWQSSTYHWSKRPDGLVVLGDYEHKISAPGNQHDIVEFYQIKLWNVNINQIRADRFDFDHFRSLLPKNMDVVDRITNKQYQLGGGKISILDRLKPLAEELRARGFAKEPR